MLTTGGQSDEDHLVSGGASVLRTTAPPVLGEVVAISQLVSGVWHSFAPSGSKDPNEWLLLENVSLAPALPIGGMSITLGNDWILQAPYL